MNVVLQYFSLCRDVPPSSPNPDSISDQKCHFPHRFLDMSVKFHTRFQTWPLGRNHVILTKIREQTKNPLNAFGIRIFLFVLIHVEGNWSEFPREPYLIPNKMDKVYTRFQTKRPKNHTPWGRTYLYGLYRGGGGTPPGLGYILRDS